MLGQGADRPCRVRLTLPDGSGGTGELQIAALQAITAQPEDPSLGRSLFELLLPHTLAAQYRGALQASGRRGIRLSLQLDETVPALHRVPWERLEHPVGETWAPLAAAPNVVFSRKLNTGQAWGLPLPAGALRVLVCISSPFQSDNLLNVDVDAERATIEPILKSFGDRVAYDVLGGAITAQQLAEALNRAQGYDVLYYIGHGDWREEQQTAYLILSQRYEDGSIGPSGVAADELARLFSALPRLPQLIVLGACQSGQQSTGNAFLGVAPQLVEAGCSAVIGMQERVENEVVRAFSAAFFTTLLESGCVDLAVNRARAGLLEHRYAQWAVPVLYMRLVDGILFNPAGRFQPAQRAPYKFLSPYGYGDQDLFKGRKDTAAVLQRSIGDHAVTLVYGEAGVGITSLLEAGVRYKLESSGRMVTMIDAYDDPACEFRLRFQWQGRPLALPLAGDAALPQVLSSAAAVRPEPLVLILDQFERALRLPAAQQLALAQDLNRALQVLGDRLRLVLALHQDVLGDLIHFQDLISTQAGPWIEILPLGLEDAVSAILDPLDVLGWPVTLDPLLAREQIVPDLCNLYTDRTTPGVQPQVDPGQLQITCNWLYNAARSRRPPLIDENLYVKEGGGADGILMRYMEEELQTRFADQSALARAVLIAMADPDQDHWNAPEELQARVQPTPALDVLTAMLERLTHAELLMRRRKEGRDLYTFANQVIADEAARLGGEAVQQTYHARDELERVWRLWLADQARLPQGSARADRALATRYQLRVLSENERLLDTRPVKLLLLLRSAVLRDEPPLVWLTALRTSEADAGLIQALETAGAQYKKSPVSSSARELSGRLLGINNPDLAAMPDQAAFGRLTWAAIAAQDQIDRRTALFALTVLPDSQQAILARLQAALQSLPSPVLRILRRAETWGALMDLLEPIGEAAAKASRSFPPFERLEIYLWRVLRRIQRDSRRIAALALGAGIGGGLGLALKRLVAGALAQSPLATVFFALFSYWGMILMGITALFLAAAPSLRLSPPHTQTNPSSTRLEIFWGGVGFGLANLMVAVLNGISLARAGMTIPFGFVAGWGAAFALTHKRSRLQAWIGLGVGTVIFGLVQAIFLLNPAWGSGLSIALSSGFFEVEFDHFTAPFWQNFISTVPIWSQIMAQIESIFAALAMLGGAYLGHSVAGELYRRYQALLDRRGE